MRDIARRLLSAALGTLTAGRESHNELASIRRRGCRRRMAVAFPICYASTRLRYARADTYPRSVVITRRYHQIRLAWQAYLRRALPTGVRTRVRGDLNCRANRRLGATPCQAICTAASTMLAVRSRGPANLTWSADKRARDSRSQSERMGLGCGWSRSGLRC